MTKSTARKTTSATKKDEIAPMDPTAVETTAAPAPIVNHPRRAYALDTLIAEAVALFPETTYEVSGVNGRNTALVVTFELASMSDDDAETLKELIRLAGSDARISDVTHDADEQLLSVALWPNARTQDDREPFGLADAYNVLAESHPTDTEGDGATS